jgi:hypothetical protein
MKCCIEVAMADRDTTECAAGFYHFLTSLLTEHKFHNFTYALYFVSELVSLVHDMSKLYISG